MPAQFRRFRVAMLCTGMLGLVACAGSRPAPRMVNFDEFSFREHVRVLASDEFEGRKPASTGEDKTVAYLVAQFQKAGLKPGNGESYLQQVPMVESLAGADSSLSISGHGASLSFAYDKDMVVWSKQAVPTSLLAQSELVFVGYGIVAPEYAWNDYAGTDVRGKTVLVMMSDPGFATKNPNLFKGNSLTSYARWEYKVQEAARRGASGVLLIHDAATAGYGWDVVVSSWSGPQLDKATKNPNAGRAAIEGWVSAAAARALFVQAGLDYSALTSAAGRPGFTPVSMGLKVDAAVHSVIRRFSSSNVIALVPGGKRRREIIIYSAHWDHLGRAPGSGGADIYHGAVDNASGVSGLLLLARAFQRTQPAPDRSIVFLALTGEESGLLGSAYYTENPVYPLKNTVADINMDALHIGGPTRDVTVFGFGQSELESYLKDAADLQGRELHPDPKPELGQFYRSDQYSFAKSGVPVLYAVGGIDDSARGPVYGQAQLDDYLEHRYHQPSDEYSPDWDVRGTLEDLRLYYEVGKRLAQTGRFPNWYPNSEFRAIRDRSRDGESN